MKTTTLVLALALAVPVAAPAVAQKMGPKAPDDAAPVMVIDTPTFLKMATGSDLFEIQSSQLAKEKAESSDLKMFADMIVEDHSNAEAKLKATLEGKGKSFSPEPPAPKQQKMLDQLKATSGKDFDTLYLDMQAQAHMEAVALFRTYAGSGDDVEVVGFAKETLPRLETHLGHVKELIVSR